MEQHAPLIVLIGPSGSGKSTHLRELALRYSFILLPTETDRPQRAAEDTVTHTFISTDEIMQKIDSGQYLGHGSMHGYHYGLPPIPETVLPVVVPLRALFIPAVWQHRPDAKVIQFEASPETLIERLHARGDSDRADPKQLALETAMGRKFTSLVISTDQPFEASFAEFERIWRDVSRQ